MTQEWNNGLLGSCLQDILRFVKPMEEDRLKRQQIIDELGNLLQSEESFRYATIKPFGSYVSNLDTKWGDLDIAIQISNNPKTMVSQFKKRNLLCQLRNLLRSRGIGCKFQYIPLARVPLLIYESSQQKISCDISIDNHFVQIKSKFLLWISQMDARFRDLILLVKLWAKAHNINNAKSGTLNSYSLCLLVIFHLQTCQPAILPPLSEIYGGNVTHDIREMGSVAEVYIKQTSDVAIASFRTGNRASVSELLVSFFEKFSEIRNKSSRYAICTSSGRWESIYSKAEWMEKSYDLIIEDPFDLPENAARAVGASELINIAGAFSETSWKLSASHVFSNRRSLLDCIVGPDIRCQLDAKEAQRLTYSNMGDNRNILTAAMSSGSIHRTGNQLLERNNSAQHRQRIMTPATSSDIYRGLDHQFDNGLLLDDEASAPVTSRRQGTANFPSYSISRSDPRSNYTHR